MKCGATARLTKSSTLVGYKSKSVVLLYSRSPVSGDGRGSALAGFMPGASSSSSARGALPSSDGRNWINVKLITWKLQTRCRTYGHRNHRDTTNRRTQPELLPNMAASPSSSPQRDRAFTGCMHPKFQSVQFVSHSVVDGHGACSTPL